MEAVGNWEGKKGMAKGKNGVQENESKRYRRGTGGMEGGKEDKRMK